MEVPHRVGDNGGMQRNTRQRAAILETLSRQVDFRSAQQIHEQMRADGETVGLATVYRNLQALSRAGRLDVLVAGDGESLYRQCEDTGHHHHLVCRECGRTVEFLAPKLEASMTAIAREHGFTEVDHTLEVFGLCEEHSSRDDAAAAPEHEDDADADDAEDADERADAPGAGTVRR
jgi:Fur family ferric uptake transcriptional regulator